MSITLVEMTLGGSDPTALALATVSIALSFVTLTWNILNATLLDRARLALSIDFMSIVDAHATKRVVTVSATNVGRRPVHLTGLWLCFGRPYGWWTRLIPKPVRSKVLPGFVVMNPSGNPRLDARSTKLPVMLGPGESAYVYDYEQQHVLDNARTGGFTHAYARAFGSTAGGSSRRIRLPVRD